MDISFNQESWLRRTGTLFARDRDAAGCLPASLRQQEGLDWQGLCARLSAAYALRRSLAASDLAGAPASGSFNDAVAGSITTYGASRQGATPPAAPSAAPSVSGQWGDSCEVNPIGLANGKAACGMNDEVAGDHASGDRGLK